MFPVYMVLVEAVKISDEISRVSPTADVYHLAIERFQKFCQFLFSVFDHVSDFHLIERTDYSTTCETLNKAESLPSFRYNVNSLKFVAFT